MPRPSKIAKALELLISSVDLLNQYMREIEPDAHELETLRKLKPHLVIISKAINLTEITPDNQAPDNSGLKPVTQVEANKRVKRIRKKLSQESAKPPDEPT